MITKVALNGAGAPTVAGSVSSGVNYLTAAVIDPAAGFVYFGGYAAWPAAGYVVKVATNGAAAPTVVGTLQFNAGENNVYGAAAIDPAAGYAYFGTSTSPGIVVKVALNGAGVPTRSGALTLNPGENSVRVAVIDPAGGYAYFGMSTAPGIVVKVDLNTFTRVGALTLNPGEDSPSSAVIDPAGGYAYVGTSTAPGIVAKVALNGAGVPTRVGALTLNPGEDSLRSAVIDLAGGYAYFGTGTTPGIVVKVALNGAATPTRVGALTLNPGENSAGSAAIDPSAGFAYFSVGASPGTAAKIAVSQRNAIKATRVALSEGAIVNDVRFYSHAAAGSVRLGVYDDASPKNLLWQSGVIANNAGGALLTAAISSGSPTSLTLSPGTYWLTWQVDTTADVPSYTAGAAGDGFYLSQVYGPFPATTAGGIPTSERYTEYVTYTGAPVVTGATTASGSIGASFSYTIEATNTPTSFEAANLPGGLSVDTHTGAITGTPTAAGTTDVTISATNGAGTDSATLRINVAPSGPPSINGLTASQDPVKTGVGVTFNASASQPDSLPLTYIWDFGDGSPVSTEQNPTHTYAAFGTYTATVTVSDGYGGTATVSATVTVISAGGFIQGDTDTDGDGYYDEIETALGSGPADAGSRPLGLAAVTTNGNLYTVKTNIRLNFAKPQGNDSITMTGVVFIPAGFSIAGQTVIVDVGGVVKAFALDAKGASPKGNERFAVRVKAPGGVVPLQEAKFTLTMKKGTYAATLLNDGLLNDDVLKSVTVPETVIFNGEVLKKAAALIYRGQKGRMGMAR